MIPSFLSNKYFIWLVILIFTIFNLSAKVAQADFGDVLQFIIPFVIGIVFAFVLTAFIGPGLLLIGEASLIGAEAVVAGAAADVIISILPILFETSLFTFTTTDLIAGIVVGGVFRGLCYGAGIGFSSSCGDDEESPDVFFLGNFTPRLDLPAPKIVSKNFKSTCDSITLSYSVLNVTHYAIYRNEAEILESDICVPRGGTETPFLIEYTDSGLKPNTDYVYELAVTDTAGQPFKFPADVIRTKSPPNCGG